MFPSMRRLWCRTKDGAILERTTEGCDRGDVQLHAARWCETWGPRKGLQHLHRSKEYGNGAESRQLHFISKYTQYGLDKRQCQNRNNKRK